MHYRVLILTPLGLEYKAVSRHLADKRSYSKIGLPFEHGTFQGQHHTYEIEVIQTGMRNMEMAIKAEKGIALIKPHIIILSGVAGAIKDLDIGDVVVATKASLASATKEDRNRSNSRPEVYYFSEDLLAHAVVISRENKWKNRTLDGAQSAKIVFGGIVTDDKVVASDKSPIYKRLRIYYNDSISVDMESAGLGRILLNYRQIHGLIVRGISDQIVNKAESDAGGSQDLAADRAAAFIFQLLYELEGSDFLLVTTSTNTEGKLNLVNEPVSIVSIGPTGDSHIDFYAREAYKLIFSTITNGANTTAGKAVLSELQGTIDEEFEQLKLVPTDDDRQAALRYQIKRQLTKDSKLVDRLFEIIRQSKKSANLFIENNKNVLQTNQINVAGDFHIGDKKSISHIGAGDIISRDKIINISNSDRPKSDITHQDTNRKHAKIDTVLLAKIQLLVASSRTLEAIELTLKFVSETQSPLINDAIIISNSWENLHLDKNRGTITNDEAYLHTARIISRLLSLLDKLK